MRSAFVLLCGSLVLGCGDDGPSGQSSTTSQTASSTSTTTPMMTETTQSTTPPGDSTTTVSGDSSTTAPACGMAGAQCGPGGCCDGFICVEQADLTEICCEVGDGNCYCACENHEGLDAVPEACTGLDVPPFDDFAELAGWLEGPSTIRGTSHAPYYCSSLDISDPFSVDIDCPCTGFLDFVQVELPSDTFELGESMATFSSVSASCRDVCSPDGFDTDLTFEILAVSETCIIGETVGLMYDTRIYVDRTPCP